MHRAGVEVPCLGLQSGNWFLTVMNIIRNSKTKMSGMFITTNKRGMIMCSKAKKGENTVLSKIKKIEWYTEYILDNGLIRGLCK